jgi:hypothetical protein
MEIRGTNVGNSTNYDCNINYKITGTTIRNTNSTCLLNPDLITANWTEPTPCEGMVSLNVTYMKCKYNHCPEITFMDVDLFLLRFI